MQSSLPQAQEALPGEVTTPPARDLLDLVLQATEGSGDEPSLLEKFQREPSPGKALAWWLGAGFDSGGGVRAKRSTP